MAGRGEGDVWGSVVGDCDESLLHRPRRLCNNDQCRSGWSPPTPRAIERRTGLPPAGPSSRLGDGFVDGSGG